MPPRAWTGIDPGQTGAIAIVTESGEARIWDWPGDECLLADLLREIVAEWSIRLAWVERQQAMPKQGVSSTFVLGRNYGTWLGALACLGVPFAVQTPAEWRRGLGYPVGDPKAGKAHALTLARRLYPGVADSLARVKDHGRAEALLMAHQARNGHRSYPPELEFS